METKQNITRIKKISPEIKTAAVKEEKKKQKREEQEKQHREVVFQSYIENLGLTREDLKKKILDVGSGPSDFTRYAREHDFGSDIYSIDKINWETLDSGIKINKERFTIAQAEAIPFRDNSFDLVISHASVPGAYMEIVDRRLKKPAWQQMGDKVAENLLEMLRVVKPGGEIRFTYERKVPGSPWVPLEEEQESLDMSLDAVLEDLKKEDHVIVEETFRRSFTRGSGVSYNLYLIKIKKPMRYKFFKRKRI